MSTSDFNLAPRTCKCCSPRAIISATVEVKHEAVRIVDCDQDAVVCETGCKRVPRSAIKHLANKPTWNKLAMPFLRLRVVALSALKVYCNSNGVDHSLPSLWSRQGINDDND